MILSDRDIHESLREGSIEVTPPLPDSHHQPASLELRLSNEFLRFRRITDCSPLQLERYSRIHLKAREAIEHRNPEFRHYYLDPREGVLPEQQVREVVPDGEPFLLMPDEFVLGSTQESITLGSRFAARVDGKSSLGRLGLLVHVTAGFIDPGWHAGQITLELKNIAPLPIVLWPGMKICNLVFEETSSPVDRPYGHPELNSHYQGQQGVTSSRPL